MDISVTINIRVMINMLVIVSIDAAAFQSFVRGILVADGGGRPL